MDHEPAAYQVTLLKTRSTPSDGYEDFFRAAKDPEFAPVFAPVLTHSFLREALEHVERLIVNGAFGQQQQTSNDVANYGGIIFTSQRAVEAFVSVIDRLKARNIVLDRLLPQSCQLFAVGPATARGLRAADTKCIIEGEGTGSGERLASYIQEQYTATVGESSASNRTRRLPLLFLVGEQRRDIIPKTLQDESQPSSQRIAVDEITVYETRVMDDFRASLKTIVESRLKTNETQWIVVFSPTGCETMLNVVGLLSDSRKVIEHSRKNRNVRIATIGPTTKDHLVNEFNFEPDVCASMPAPEALGHAIQTYMKRTVEI